MFVLVLLQSPEMHTVPIPSKSWATLLCLEERDDFFESPKSRRGEIDKEFTKIILISFIFDKHYFVTVKQINMFVFSPQTGLKWNIHISIIIKMSVCKIARLSRARRTCYKTRKRGTGRWDLNNTTMEMGLLRESIKSKDNNDERPRRMMWATSTVRRCD